MIGQLDRKLLRDLARMKGQAVAVCLVMACGLAMLIMARSLIHSLETTRQSYYRAHRFADLFVHLKRAPLEVARRARAIAGVAEVQPGISAQVTLDIDGLVEPASGLVRSLPDEGTPLLNRLFLRSGQWLEPGARGAVLVGEAFALANRLRPGDTMAMILNGRLRRFRVNGIVLSPEFVFESRPGSALPDNRTYGIFWMPYEELANAFDMDQAFNHLALALGPGASEKAVSAELDRLLLPYGGRGAFGRQDHPSDIRVSDEIRVLTTLSIGFPMVFLSVSAFMTNSVLSRLLNLQREQVAILKAFGYSDVQIAWHYLKFAIVFVCGGTLIGAVGGVLLGANLVDMYHRFFRFPALAFQVDAAALGIALGVGVGAAMLGVLGAVRRAAKLPPAEAMRPEPPASFRPSFLERAGLSGHFSNPFRMAVRNLERKPWQAFFTASGLSLATAILIIPNAFRDSVREVLGFQWDIAQRHDVSLGLIEPDSQSTLHDFARLPGVVSVEAFRNAAARIHFGHRSRQVGISGLPSDSLHERAIDAHNKQIPLPPDGLVISVKLAEVLGARRGDLLKVEFLEGQRRVREVPLLGLSDDFAGIKVNMERGSLNRLMGEGDVVTGATFCVDSREKERFLAALKRQPRVAWVAVKESLRANFRETTAASINLIQSIYLTFATVVAFGVVYNNARISLAERGRDLATLRVIGFTQPEVARVLILELGALAFVAVPLGLLLGTGFATGIIQAVNTETVRLPLVLTRFNYTFAVIVVFTASLLSAGVVLRKLKQLNLVGALRAPE